MNQAVRTELSLVQPEAWLLEQQGVQLSEQRRHRVLVWGWRVALVTALLVVWQLAADRHWVEPFFISSPRAVGQFFLDAFQSRLFWEHVSVTTQEAMASFVIGSVAAIATGFLLSQSRIARDVARPLLTIMNSMPRVALAPLLIIWFGLGMGSKIAVGVSLTFFVVLNGTLVGVDSVDPDLRLLGRQLGLSRASLFRRIVLPSSIVSIFAALNLGLIYGFLGVVVAEMLGAPKGLGHLLQYNAGLLRTEAVLGIVAFLGIFVAMLVSVLERIEANLLRWQKP